MHWIDWAIVAGYVVLAFAVGLVFTKRASRGTEEMFLAGRTLPWFRKALRSGTERRWETGW